MHTLSDPLSFITMIFIAIVVRGWMRKKGLCLLNRFRETGAYDSEHTIPVKEIPEKESWLFDRLLHHDIIVIIPEGKCFLDEKALKRYRKQKQVISLIALVIILVILIAVDFVFC